jgi:hypothetical protein
MFNTADDFRDASRSLLNQVPETMPASRSTLHLFSSISATRESTSEKVNQYLASLTATFGVCIIELENRLEQLEGRPGLPDSTWQAIISEFRSGR